MSKKYVEYGPWFTYNSCPSCKSYVSDHEIYTLRCCKHCGASGVIMLEYCVTTTRRAYTKKSWLPWRNKFEMEVKSIKPRFSGGGGGYSNPAFNSALGAGMSLTATAAAISIL